MDKLLEDLAEVVRQRNAAEYAAVALSADDFYAENKEFRSKAVRFIATHHAEIAEAVADAAKWKKVEAVVAMAEDESDGQINTACGLLLIDRAASVNAGKMELKFSGVTGKNDAELGDWVVTVKKDAQHNSAREGE